jgi:hypothetical protein
MLRTVTPAEITAARLRRMAHDLMLEADRLEATVPGRKLTGGMSVEEVRVAIKKKISKARREQ